LFIEWKQEQFSERELLFIAVCSDADRDRFLRNVATQNFFSLTG
jgi:hypothetical protein